MADGIFAAAGLLLLMTAAGLAALWRRGNLHRMLAVQLVGSAGCAVLLLLSVAMGDDAILDVALLLALLAAFAVSAFAASASGAHGRGEGGASATSEP
ncbi:monovalent cation/H+ antiporter complex subunit F [Xanthobacter autotrophicus DSM 431]|uniref:monovalent cation/H+ antiporter complex subunit F n=1 Tax=Xanthobacter nonsaccharivorans TaxID=3119912 RepID=UPI00372CE12D